MTAPVTTSMTTIKDLVEKYGGKKVGGGTCFITNISDIDIEVDIVELINLTAALEAAFAQR